MKSKLIIKCISFIFCLLLVFSTTIDYSIFLVEAAYNGETPYVKKIDGVDYVIQEFRSLGTFTIPKNVTKVDIAVYNVGDIRETDQKEGSTSGKYFGLLKNDYSISAPAGSIITIAISEGGDGDYKMSCYDEDGILSRIINIALGINISSAGGSGVDAKGCANGSNNTSSLPDKGSVTGLNTIVGTNGVIYDVPEPSFLPSSSLDTPYNTGRGVGGDSYTKVRNSSG